MVDASQVLGSPQIAGLIVVPKGSGASAARAASMGSGGLLTGPVVATALKQLKRQSQLNDVVFDTPHPGGGLLALTAQELALVAGRGHSKVMARMPRSEIVFAKKFGMAFPTTAPFVIVFKDGHAWYFEVQWNRWRAAKKILSLLNAEKPVASQS